MQLSIDNKFPKDKEADLLYSQLKVLSLCNLNIFLETGNVYRYDHKYIIPLFFTIKLKKKRKLFYSVDNITKQSGPIIRTKRQLTNANRICGLSYANAKSNVSVF